MSWLTGDHESAGLAKEIQAGTKKIEEVPAERKAAVQKILDDERWRRRWRDSGYLGQMPKEKK